MRKFLITLAPLLLLVASPQSALAVKRSTVVGAGAGAVAGGVVAGPAGAVVGGVAGGYVGSKYKTRRAAARRHHH